MEVGIDPIENHVKPPIKLRYRRAKGTDRLATSTRSTAPVASTSTTTSRKRTADGSPIPGERAVKRSKTDSDSPEIRMLDCDTNDDEDGFPPKLESESDSDSDSELQNQTKCALQVCRYLLEMFSVPLLRSHATISLVDRDRLQLYHANRSVILVSSAIKFSEGDGKDKFIATIIAFHCLSLEQNGILESRVPKNAEMVSKTMFLKDDRAVQRGKELCFPKRGKDIAFKVKLHDVISRDPAVVGRSTVVLNATSRRWKEVPLVVKVSWPTSSRVSETEFLKKASATAEGEHEWAAKHLPRMYYTEDVVFSTDSTLESVAGLFEGATFADGKEYVYERRTMRIIIQERLHPLRSLGSVKDIGQVLLDVACGMCVPFRFSVAIRLCLCV